MHTGKTKRTLHGNVRVSAWPLAAWATFGWATVAWTTVAWTTVACGNSGGDAAPIENVASVALDRAVALTDPALDRVVLLQTDGSGGLQQTEVSVGQNPRTALADVDGQRLLVLSDGVQPRLEPEDELPSLSVVATGAEPSVVARYELSERANQITLDPTGRWAVLTAREDEDLGLATNPNQLLLVDLEDSSSQPVSKTIRSFGSSPQRFRFTEPLDVPGGERRFLVVETGQDISLIDLADIAGPEITIGLPQTSTGGTGRPAQVVAHPGSDSVEGDAQLAIRLADDSNVVLVAFTADPEAEGEFNLTLNLVDVGSAPTAIDFVDTDGGLRLAALNPRDREGALIHLDTTRVDRVGLPEGFTRLTRVPRTDLGEDANGDLALLWTPSSARVALWSLGRTGDRAFRSVEVLDLEAEVSQVHDVPGGALAHRMLLQSEDSRFFVLDLQSAQSFPMVSRNRMDLSVASDGLRAWAYEVGTTRLAHVDLETLQLTSLDLQRPIRSLFDIRAIDSDERALVALHPGGGFGATVMNARQPDTATTRFYPGLLLGGIQ